MVYIDNMNAGYGRMIMCHMIADTSEELIRMAALIGVNRKWIQEAGTNREHFDVCKSAKAKAIKYGAIEITMRELSKRVLAKIEKNGPCNPTENYTLQISRIIK